MLFTIVGFKKTNIKIYTAICLCVVLCWREILSATLMQDKYTGRDSKYNGEDNIWTRCQALNGMVTLCEL
jgi:hypothetical protein